MSASIGRVHVTLRTASGARERGDVLARELRWALPRSLTDAAARAARGASGVVLVPRVHVTMRGALDRLRANDVARALAQASVDAAVARSARSSTSGEDASVAQSVVEALRSGTAVRCASPAEVAAAWLVALALDEPGMLRFFSPFVDLRGLPWGTAFAQLCARVRDANAVIAALGRSWSQRFASTCSAADARLVIGVMADDDEPAAQTWAFLATRVAAADDGARTAQARALLGAAIDGRFERRPGIVTAVRSMLVASRRPAQRTDGLRMASNLTGVWLLWRHLAPFVAGCDERTARAVALALSERLGGSFAAGDPAIEALCDAGDSIRDLRAALPGTVHVGRLTVSVVRDFARGLPHFQNARPGYILRAILSGPGSVTRTTAGWSATLPHSPLRVVLERAALLGEVDVPWKSPRLLLVRDDD
jgi:hypothetical protein